MVVYQKRTICQYFRNYYFLDISINLQMKDFKLVSRLEYEME